METRLAGREATQTAQRDEISQLKETWLPPLQRIIDTINAQFADYFRQIKCAGEIALKIPANPVSVSICVPKHLPCEVMQNPFEQLIFLCLDNLRSYCLNR